MVDEEKRGRGRPRTGQMPKRPGLRIGSAWDDAASLAEERGETMTAFLTRALERENKRIRRGA